MMAWLANPDWAVLLILAGILLIYTEFNRPGTVVLGCAGALAVMLGLHGLGGVAISGAGPGLVAVGVALVVVGCAYPVRGMVAVAGAVCVGWGLMALTTPRVHAVVAVGAAGIFSGVTTWLGRIAMLGREKKRVPGAWEDGKLRVRAALAERAE